MKKKKSLQTKKILLLGIFILASIFLFENITSQGGQTTLYCAERTTYGAWCQNVPFNEVNTRYRYDRTSCEATSYCSPGTCVNTVTGDCLPATQATCNPEQGGFFYSQPKDEVAQCRVGCCLLGDGASLVERAKCDTLGSDYNVKATFRADITDEVTCLAMASPEEKGACVFETDMGRDCKHLTREQCGDSRGDFHAGFLCTAPELGTNCATTQRTKCVEGKHEVYFVDSCGNVANIYDANKINDINYWRYFSGVQGVEVDFGDRKGNINSRIYGACNYLEGSTCGPGDAQYGNFICRDLGCPASELTGGIRRDHGGEWCASSTEVPASINDFEDSKPGQLSYLLYCYQGEVHYELCDHFRNKLCLENEEIGAASCVANRWSDCLIQETTRDCLDESRRDCEFIRDASAATLRTMYGTEKQIRDSDTGEMITGTCVPKYPPGFKFWDPTGTMLDAPGETPLSICEFASVSCYVPYTQEIAFITTWKVTPSEECIELCESERKVRGLDFAGRRSCYDECTPVCLEDRLDDKDADAGIDQTWAQVYQNLCVSLGDCGVTTNYLGKEGFNKWRDLFIGEKIDWATLVTGVERN